MKVIIFYKFTCYFTVIGFSAFYHQLPFMSSNQITRVRRIPVRTNGTDWQKKLERLSLIKERYEKLVLEPRREIEFELEKDLEDENSSDLRFSNIPQV